ncbi:RNA polymerase II transcription elongation factor-domain-containing protein [Mycena sanguinolenta]|nr:RNA polymerase II transcription elongation factor-domain-containing protein [Mycena sanguinolenta]
MAPEDNSWIPQGTHEVQIGPSLNKALKARKGGPPPQVKRTGPPEKDFYSFRYNRKPPSLDTTKPGTIEVSRGKDTTTVVVEHPSSQPGENHVYTGTVRTETSGKELDCVLIYDEETGFYKLEKLESYIALNYDRKTIVYTDSETRLSQEIDAVGEPDEDALPSHFLAQEEEESEEDLEPVPVLPPPPPPPVVKPAKAPAPKPAPAPTPASRPTKPIPQRKTTTKKALPPPVSAPEFEDIPFERPAVKRAKHTAPPPPVSAPAAPVAFSLPGSSSSWVPPPAPAAPVAPSPIAVADDSEEEEEWDEVTAAPIADLEFELNLQAEMEAVDADADADADADRDDEEEEDFLADVLPQAPDSAVTPVRPLSISQLAGYSDDEYSSSEESDED